MYSLIVVIVAIALVVLLATAGVFYGGDAYEEANEKVQVVSLCSRASKCSVLQSCFRSSIDVGLCPLRS